MSFVDNEQVNIEIYSVPELQRIITPDRVELIFKINLTKVASFTKICQFVRIYSCCSSSRTWHILKYEYLVYLICL